MSLNLTNHRAYCNQLCRDTSKDAWSRAHSFPGRPKWSFLCGVSSLTAGRVDPNAVANIKNALEAGIQYVDVYLFPCPKCGTSASEQVDEMGRSRHLFGPQPAYYVEYTFIRFE